MDRFLIAIWAVLIVFVIVTIILYFTDAPASVTFGFTGASMVLLACGIVAPIYAKRACTELKALAWDANNDQIMQAYEERLHEHEKIPMVGKLDDFKQFVKQANDGTNLLAVLAKQDYYRSWWTFNGREPTPEEDPFNAQGESIFLAEILARAIRYHKHVHGAYTMPKINDIAQAGVHCHLP